MKFTSFAIAIIYSPFINNGETTATSDIENDSIQGSLAMLGCVHNHYNPIFLDDLKNAGVHATRSRNSRRTKATKKSKKSKKNGPTEDTVECGPSDINLKDFPQWQQEIGYWIGSYTFLNGDGEAFTSNSWNYPYASYKGFITGEVSGNSYRQRNVFLYPPQEKSACDERGDEVVGNGVCGMNGNTKIFGADQQATTCTEELEKGFIDGLYQGLPTKTQLIGQSNALLYQVFFPYEGEERLLQSQLTTITGNLADGQIFRTRSAQGFEFLGFQNELGISTSSSYYRERKVNETVFMEELKTAIEAYNILPEDLCKYDSGGNNITTTGSLNKCIEHLNESFALGQ